MDAGPRQLRAGDPARLEAEPEVGRRLPGRPGVPGAKGRSGAGGSTPDQRVQTQGVLNRGGISIVVEVDEDVARLRPPRRRGCARPRRAPRRVAAGVEPAGAVQAHVGEAGECARASGVAARGVRGDERDSRRSSSGARPPSASSRAEPRARGRAGASRPSGSRQRGAAGRAAVVAACPAFRAARRRAAAPHRNSRARRVERRAAAAAARGSARAALRAAGARTRRSWPAGARSRRSLSMCVMYRLPLTANRKSGGTWRQASHAAGRVRE